MEERKYWQVETTTDQLSIASVHIQPHIQEFACAFVRINLVKKDQTVLNHLDSLPARKEQRVGVCVTILIKPETESGWAAVCVCLYVCSEGGRDCSSWWMIVEALFICSFIYSFRRYDSGLKCLIRPQRDREKNTLITSQAHTYISRHVFSQHNTAMQIPKQLHLLKNKLCVFASIYMCACGSGFVYIVLIKCPYMSSTNSLKRVNCLDEEKTK